MANQVKTVFSVDTRAAIGAIDAYERRLRLVTELESKIGTKAGGTSRGSSASSGADREMKAAMADIAKMQRERERMEREVTKSVEREARLQTQAKLREAKRSANEMIAELKRVDAAQRAGRGGLFTNAAGQLNVSSIFGGITAGYAAKQYLDFTRDAIDRTTSLERANRLLSSSALEAGQSTAFLADENKKFAAQLGITNQQAAETTSMIARLAVNSGNASQERIRQLTGAFANLGAARGIGGGDLQNLIGTILSGQDEGLNRLGISDPGQLQRAYAASIGKTVEQLTQQEKVTAAVNAVLEKAAKFTGAAEARSRSFEGQMARTTVALENFKNAMAEIVTRTPGFAQALETIARNLPGAQNNDFESRLRDGTVTQAEIEAEVQRRDRTLFGGPGGRRFNPENSVGMLLSYLRGDQQGMADTSATYYPESRQENIRQGIYQQLNAYITQRAQAEQTVADDSKKKNQEAAKATMDAWMEQIAARRRANEEAAKAEQERLQKLKEAMRSVRDTITGIEGQRNPFVSVFESAYQSLLKLRELTRGLGADIRGAAYGTVQRQALRAYSDARINAALTALELRSEASDFRSGFNIDKLTPAQQTARRLQSLQQQLSTVLGTAGQRPEFQWTEIRPSRELWNQFGNTGSDARLRDLQRDFDRRYAVAQEQYRSRYGAFEIDRASVDRQIIELTRGFRPSELDAETRNLAAGAREREAGRIAQQEQEARSLFKNLAGIINPDGIKVVLGDGEQVVRILNEAPDSATVTRRPTQAATNSRYRR